MQPVSDLSRQWVLITAAVSSFASTLTPYPTPSGAHAHGWLRTKVERPLQIEHEPTRSEHRRTDGARPQEPRRYRPSRFE